VVFGDTWAGFWLLLMEEVGWHVGAWTKAVDGSVVVLVQGSPGQGVARLRQWRPQEEAASERRRDSKMSDNDPPEGERPGETVTRGRVLCEVRSGSEVTSAGAGPVSHWSSTTVKA